jgi:glucan phosphoethanolaminetransferase (alkaline phosphatase superfamily)
MNYLKKTFQSLALGLMFLPVVVQAQFGPRSQGYFEGLFENIHSGGWLTIAPFRSRDLMDIIATIIQIAFALAGLVATFYLIMGGYNYITSGGDPEAAEGAKVMITNAIIGMVVILVSYLIVEFVLIQLGADIGLR